MVPASSGPSLKVSAFTLSCPGALTDLRSFIAKIISFLTGGLLLISRSSGISGMSISLSGGGLLSVSLK